MDYNILSECCFPACTSTVDTPFGRGGHCSVIWRSRDFLCSRYALASLPLVDQVSHRALAPDTPYHDRLVLKTSNDRFLALSALPPVITLDHTDSNSSMDTDGGDGANETEVLMVTGDSMLRISLDVEEVQAFKAE